MESNQLLINTIKLDDGYFVREISINDSEKEIIVYIDQKMRKQNGLMWLRVIVHLYSPGTR